ncbi:hypothetical protein ACJMK2_038787 [Sinanodonta woodiana]|uniref:Uncharacterized protein n=1 Tax=Sinanodonta woodiana TaxID=1069815 RepID=A0ABD3WD71_SINWO
MFDKVGDSGGFVCVSASFVVFGLLFTTNDIDSMVQVWNVHRIRPTKNQNCPNGRPVVMYKLPMIYGTRSYLQSVDEDKIKICRDECMNVYFEMNAPCDRAVLNICTPYMEKRDKHRLQISMMLFNYSLIYETCYLWICDDNGFTTTVIL